MAVTLKDVARVANTSIAAASTTLNGSSGKNTRVSQETRQRILDAATQLGYVSNPIAKSLATGKTGVLGLMLPYEDAFVDQNPFCSSIIAGILHESFARGFRIMLYPIISSMTAQEAAAQIDSRVDGLAVVMPPADSPVFARSALVGIPVAAAVCERAPGHICVNSDDEMGGRIATEHLIGLGHRRIAHLVGHSTVSTTVPRRAGYRSALAAAGIEHDPRLEIVTGFDRIDSYLRVQQFLATCPPEERPTAIFACNDLAAVGAMQALAEVGLSVPDDVAVVGYDDTSFSTFSKPPLTSVRMEIENIGVMCVRLLVDAITGKEIADRNPVLPVSLTVRHSCGAASRRHAPGRR